MLSLSLSNDFNHWPVNVAQARTLMTTMKPQITHSFTNEQAFNFLDLTCMCRDEHLILINSPTRPSLYTGASCSTSGR